MDLSLVNICLKKSDVKMCFSLGTIVSGYVRITYKAPLLVGDFKEMASTYNIVDVKPASSILIMFINEMTVIRLDIIHLSNSMNITNAKNPYHVLKSKVILDICVTK